MSKVLELVEKLEKEYPVAPVCPQVCAEVFTLAKIIRVQNEALIKVCERNDLGELIESGLYEKCSSALYNTERIAEGKND